MNKCIFFIFLFLCLPVHSSTTINGNITVNGNVEVGPPGPEIVCLGDSITSGTFFGSNNFGYRNYLQDELGIWNFTFIGQFSNGSGTTYQRRHSGVVSETNTQIKNRISTNLLLFSSTKFKNYSKFLIHAGTNDLSGSVPKTDEELQTAVDIVGTMITQIHNANPNIDIYIAKIIPSTGEPRDTNITGYNAKIPTMISGLGYSNVYYVDMNSAFKSDIFGLCSGDWATNCMQDSLHPSSAGYQTMAKMWARCINSSTAVGCNGH